MDAVRDIRIDVYGLETDQLDELKGYFLAKGAKDIYVEGDELVVTLSKEIEKGINLQKFVESIEVLVGKSLKAYFRDSCMYVAYK